MSAAHQVLYSGRVQGVGFRYTVKQIASGYEVVGWVRNLADGRVELQVSGHPEELEAFLGAIATGSLRRHIKDTERTELDAPAGEWTAFEIRA